MVHRGGVLTMDNLNKICRVKVSAIDGANVLVREDGQEWPASRYIYPDEAGESWLWDGPIPDPEPPA